MIIYIDNEYKCHIQNNDTFQKIETDFFDGKCDEYIEGYRFVPKDNTWTREDGMIFQGEMITPWKNFDELDIIQREYEKNLIIEQKAIIAELDSALLDMAYSNLV